MKSNTYERLKQARKYLNLSQEYVATQMGLQRTAITAIELGQRSVTTEELKKFSELYGLSLDELVYGEDQNSEVKVLTRRYSELSEDDKREILNLVEFKLRLKKMRTDVAE
jgi:transcriptional regulator with XRE-family HTH domain